MLVTALVEKSATKFLIIEFDGKFYIRAYSLLDRHSDIARKFAKELGVSLTAITPLGGGHITVRSDRVKLYFDSTEFGSVPNEMRDFLKTSVQELFPNHTIDDTHLHNDG